MPNAFRIGIAGLGTVGAGLVKLLTDNADLIAARTGRAIEIVGINARSRGKDRGVDLSRYQWFDDPVAMASDERIDAVVELIGGSEGVAYTLVKTALGNGKHVVTANKALLAHKGMELARIAEEKGVGLQYEAAVAGGIPIIKSMREGFAGNNIHQLHGILNGTCNYILTEMRLTGRSFEDVLGEAQAKGYAEADPSFDIDGVDAAHKLCILSALAFGLQPDFTALDVQGIRAITASDIAFADELGYRIKLLGIARRNGDKISQSVEPCLVPQDSPIGTVEGVFNAVMAEGDFVGRSMSEGRGAGAGPTASAVMADIMDLARGVTLPVFGVSAGHLKKVSPAAPEEITGGYYLHLVVLDQPGVIADLSAVLRDHKISIEALLQRGRDPGQPVSIVIVTHEINQAAMRRAVAEIGYLSTVTQPPTCLRIEHI